MLLKTSMRVLLVIFIGTENNHQFSSCWIFEFNLPLDFAPLKYKRKGIIFFFALAAKEENEVAEHTKFPWKRQFPEALKEEELLVYFVLNAFSKSPSSVKSRDILVNYSFMCEILKEPLTR